MNLLAAFGNRIKTGEPLSRHTTYRIGGPADFYFAAQDAAEAARALAAAKSDGLPVFVLGGGSNLLVADAGFRGLVLVLADRTLRLEGTALLAGAGLPLAAAVNAAAEAGLSGLEWAAGIPGTVGGAVRGNAGAYGGEMKDIVRAVSAIGLSDGQAREIPDGDCGFGYRESRFKREPLLIVRTALELRPGDPAALRASVRETIDRRLGKLPTGYGSAGSVFKNIPFEQLADLPASIRDSVPEDYRRFRKLPAAWLIERLDLKGYRIGQAQISEKHANYFVNLGGATADQVYRLISYVKMKVRDGLGIQLEEEIQYVGFDN